MVGWVELFACSLVFRHGEIKSLVVQRSKILQNKAVGSVLKTLDKNSKTQQHVQATLRTSHQAIQLAACIGDNELCRRSLGLTR